MWGWSATHRATARAANSIGSVADADLNPRDASHAFDGFASLAGEGCRIVTGEDEREADTAGLIDVEIAHHARRQHVAAIPWIANAAKRLLDACLEIRRAHDWPAPAPFVRNLRAALSTLSSTSAIVPANDAPAAR